MKTIYYLSFSLLCSFCFSCTEELSTLSEEEPKIELVLNKSATRTFTNEISTGNIPMIDAFDVNNQTQVPLIDDDVIPLSYTGYQTIKLVTDFPLRLGVSKDVAASLGIDPTRTYVCTKYEVKLRSGFNDGLKFVQLPSPLCGYYTTFSTPYERGYTWETVANTNSIIMTTSIYKCSSDSQGQHYDNLWIPCKKEDIVWDFGVK